MFHACDLYVSCLRPLCFTFAASMFHACGLYLRHMATIREDCVLGRKEAIRGACCALWLWEAGLQTTGLGGGLETSGLGLCFLARAFRSCFSVVLFVVRSFWSFFSWFVLLVRAFGRSFRGSCFGFVFCGSFFWFVLLGARMCFLFDALKFLEACVARSEVS